MIDILKYSKKIFYKYNSGWMIRIKRLFVLMGLVMIVFMFSGFKHKQIEEKQSNTNMCWSEENLSNDFYKNFRKSQAEYNKAITYFKVNEENQLDEFGGVFVDKEGIINICIVGNNIPYESEFLRYKQVSNSYNILKRIGEELQLVLKEYTIWMRGICESCNYVIIRLEEESNIPLVINYLKVKGVYKQDFLNFL